MKFKIGNRVLYDEAKYEYFNDLNKTYGIRTIIGFIDDNPNHLLFNNGWDHAKYMILAEDCPCGATTFSADVAHATWCPFHAEKCPSHIEKSPSKDERV